MRIRAVVSLLALGLTLTLAGGVGAAVTVGETAPDFTLEDTNGNTHTLSDYRGQFVVLEWINHDCPFVRKMYNSGKMQELQKKYRGKDVLWFSVSSSAHGKQGHYHPDEANALTEQKGAAPTAVLMDFDGIAGRKYGAQTTPHMFVIDPEGTLIYQGAIDSIPSVDTADVPRADNYVEMALDAAMAGEPVPVASTKSYGCSVKY